MPKTVPLRTCIGCRTKKPKSKLLRIVINQKGEIVIDKKEKAPGRGAYLCKKKNGQIKSSCLKQAIEKKAFKHAYKKEINTIKILPTAGSSGSRPC